jgi:sulfoxide reductase catalytic subunit YedY
LPGSGGLIRETWDILGRAEVFMLIRKSPGIRSSEVTDETNYLNRRQFLRISGIVAAGSILGTAGEARAASSLFADGAFVDLRKSELSTNEPPNSFEDVTTYNNFYEFGTGKQDPARYSGDFLAEPWKVAIAGECDKPGTYNLEDILAPLTFEDRIYRLRCVEAWSMVIPWVGFPLSDLIKRFAPNSNAKYVKFTTLFDPAQMPGQRRRVIEWPYVEGLTMAEAMHPLTIMAVGVYGKPLPNQNGAPMRLVVPWKYGFKSIKTINRIEFTSKRPVGSWEESIPSEYGFYANVNPEVDHPRWSQARERRIGAGVFAAKQPTLPFNGYAEQVADLYRGLDLRRNY